jgi:hypothetical protein
MKEIPLVHTAALYQVEEDLHTYNRRGDLNECSFWGESLHWQVNAGFFSLRLGIQYTLHLVRLGAGGTNISRRSDLGGTGVSGDANKPKVRRKTTGKYRDLKSPSAW